MEKVVKEKCEKTSLCGFRSRELPQPFFSQPMSYLNKCQNIVLAQKLNLYRMIKPNPIFTAFVQVSPCCTETRGICSLS